ncbi:MAG: hypothetical protein ACI4JM_09370 [Oscillospiraceae bacterium]
MSIELDKNEYSVEKDMNKIYFDAREWQPDKEYSETNKGERTFITSFDGSLVEAYSFGSWSDEEISAISTKQLILKKNSDYRFTFWLNGGENERQTEICQLIITFNNDNENKRIYKLNRNYIKPLKYHKGWLLFEIPFSTEDNEFTQLKFIVQGAVATVIPALDKENYDNLSNDAQPSNYSMRPNIAFENGYPDDVVFPKFSNPFENIPKFHDIFNVNKNTDSETVEQSPIMEKLKNTADAFDDMANEIANECSERIREGLRKAFFGKK